MYDDPTLADSYLGSRYAWGLGVCEDFLVFDTQLDVNGVPDDDEEDPGAFIAYNDDDDNENGVPDYLDDGDASEDDLAKIVLIDCLPDDLTFGFLELRVSEYAGFRVWGSEHKGDGNLLIGSGGSKRWAVDSAPTELWVEGCGTGTGQLSLWYTPDGTEFPGGLFNCDKVNVTIVQVHMNMDGVAESGEESVGGYIALGSDDTELYLNGVSGPPPPFDEDHPIILDVEYSSMGSGTIEIWDYSYPLAPVEVNLPATYDSAEFLLDDLRVKGASVSYAVNYITLIWEYSIQGRTIQDRIGVTVVEADLDIDGVDDDDEESVGQEVLLKTDDNDAPRKEVIIRKVTPNAWDGDVILSCSNTTKVDLFDSVTGGAKITFDDSDNRFANSGLPKSLWVEGKSASGSMRDVTLQLEAEGISGCDDTVSFTVVKVDIVKPKGSLDATSNPNASFLATPSRFDFQGVISGTPGAYVLDIEGNIVPAIDPPVTYEWTLDAAAGTLTNDTTAAPTHTAPATEGQGMLTLTALIDSTDTGLKDEKEVKIYKDHLERDRENFGEGGSCSSGWEVSSFNVDPKPLMWTWNCHGSTNHAYAGYGSGYSTVLSSDITTTWSKNTFNAPITDWASVQAVLDRGDVVAYYVGSQVHHSATCIDSTTTWGANNEPVSGAETYKWHLATPQDWWNNAGTGNPPLPDCTKIIVYNKP